MKLNKLLLAALSTTFILTHPSLAMKPKEESELAIHIRRGAAELRAAVAVGNIARVQTLLFDEGVDPNPPLPYGEIFLHIAAELHAPIEIMQALLEAGADPHALNSNGENVFHYLDDIGQLPFFLNFGIDINKRNNDGSTPLHEAVKWRTSAFVRRLLEAGADRNIRNNNNQTPYGLAVHIRHTEHAQVLAAWSAAQLASQGKE